MSSKFRNILDAARAQGEAPIETPPPPVREAESTPDAASGKRRGRPAGGKRSDPDYEQVTAYIRKDVHRRVKIALLQEQEKTEFSQLVDQLLAEWLRTKK